MLSLQFNLGFRNTSDNILYIRGDSVFVHLKAWGEFAFQVIVLKLGETSPLRGCPEHALGSTTRKRWGQKFFANSCPGLAAFNVKTGRARFQECGKSLQAATQSFVDISGAWYYALRVRRFVCRKAVYSSADFFLGNKQLAVISHDFYFSFPEFYWVPCSDSQPGPLPGSLEGRLVPVLKNQTISNSAPWKSHCRLLGWYWGSQPSQLSDLGNGRLVYFPCYTLIDLC